MTRINDVIVSLLGEGVDPAVIADKVCAPLSAHELRPLAQRWVTQEALRIRRSLEVEAQKAAVRHDPKHHKERAQNEGRARAEIGRVVEAFKRELRAEWTEDLMRTVFATGQGSSVEWGEATAAQHESRIVYMASKVDGYVEDMALHRKAIEDIHAAQVRCLNDLRSS